jgi:propanol-preferring alcohol dehydrogenase
MRAMVLERAPGALVERDVPRPSPDDHQVLIRISACGVCRTDVHLADGELPQARLPVIPGHQIVGTVVGRGSGTTLENGRRVGVPWLGRTCGKCPFCLSRRENLCDLAEFTGCHIDGGFAEYCVADERFCFPIPDAFDDVVAAPLLCAGLIGYRAYRMAGDAPRLGLYGFGSAAHLLTQIASAEGREVFAFTRDGDEERQQFARELGAVWAGPSNDGVGQLLDAAILFAPAGELVPLALAAVRKGGTVVCAGIHMSDIPSFPYRLLWGERVLRSVANLTRDDGLALFDAIAARPPRVEATMFPLSKTADALAAVRAGALRGSAVVTVP